MPEKYGGSGLGISEATVMVSILVLVRYTVVTIWLQLQTIAESGAGIMGAQTIHANVYASTFSDFFTS